MRAFPDFALVATDDLSVQLRQMGIAYFHEAVQYIALLPYRRNRDTTDSCALLREQGGTCSTKHAALRRLAVAHGYADIQLRIGIFKMNAHNTPKVGAVLRQHALEYLPEAHCYLVYGGQVYDFTTPLSHRNPLFINDLLEEITIEAAQIATDKIGLHRAYLQKWLAAEGLSATFSLEQLWAVREACIAALQ